MRRAGFPGLSVLAAMTAAASAAAPNVQMIALTSDQRLIAFETRSTRDAFGVGTISGLDTDTRIVGIDFRPASGELYGLGDAGGVYVLNTSNAAATLKSRLTVALEGTAFGVDFNPTVDRFRIVSNTGQNLRVNVDTGAAIVDLPLVYTTTAMGVAGAAYTNNDADPNTGTTLFDIDADLDQIVIQAPPNNGNLNAVGKLRQDTSADVGFDIYTQIRNGETTGNFGFAALTVDGRSRLYEINLLTGAARKAGSFNREFQGIDLAAATNP
ncbi:MAG: hypothetical protein BroJett003_15890 [Planctomycetota bacterium]|nr:MAG: hypothetical protein BroJett003_15890 [Planctomycetota bacterium]